MAAPLSGQLTVTSSTQQLSTVTAVTAFEIKAPSTNQNIVWIGPAGVTSSTGHAMEPGDRFAYERSDQNDGPRYGLTPADFYAVGTSPDKLTWLGSP